MQGENILAARIRKIKTHGRTYFVGSNERKENGMLAIAIVVLSLIAAVLVAVEAM